MDFNYNSKFDPNQPFDPNQIPPQRPSGGGKGLIIGICVAVVVVIGAGIGISHMLASKIKADVPAITQHLQQSQQSKGNSSIKTPTNDKKNDQITLSDNSKDDNTQSAINNDSIDNPTVESSSSNSSSVSRTQIENYVEQLATIGNDSGNAFMQAGNLLSQVSSNPDLINDSSWLSKIQAQRDIVQENYNKIKELKAPNAQLASIQDNYTSGLKYGLQGLNKVISGIQQKDATLINKGVNDLETAQKEILKGADEASKLS